MSEKTEGADAKAKSAEKAEKADPNAEKKPDFFDSKLFRIITVGIYLGGVSGLGFTLALYYLFIWESKMPELPILKRI